MASIFDLARLKSEIERLQRASESPEFWANPAEAQATMQQLARLRNRIEPVERLMAQAIVPVLEIGGEGAEDGFARIFVRYQPCTDTECGLPVERVYLMPLSLRPQ